MLALDGYRCNYHHIYLFIYLLIYLLVFSFIYYARAMHLLLHVDKDEKRILVESGRVADALFAVIAFVVAYIRSCGVGTGAMAAGPRRYQRDARCA